MHSLEVILQLKNNAQQVDIYIHGLSVFEAVYFSSSLSCGDGYLYLNVELNRWALMSFLLYVSLVQSTSIAGDVRVVVRRRVRVKQGDADRACLGAHVFVQKG